MGRVINVDSAGKQRTQLTRSIVLALRELAHQEEASDHSRDLVAFIALALDAIEKTVDGTVLAWERRGYWLKADRFRLEWDWTRSISRDLRRALVDEEWNKIAQLAVQIGVRLKSVTLPQRHGLGSPWSGAWKKLSQEV